MADGKVSEMKAHAIMRGAQAGVLALALGACATAEAPQSYAAANHTGSAYLPRDMTAARRAVTASLGRGDLPGLVFTASVSQRAAIGAEGDPASAAHEADFARTGPGDNAVKVRNRPAPAPALTIKAQNQMAPQGGWRETGDAFVHDYSGMRCPKVLDMVRLDEAEEVETIHTALSQIVLYDAEGQDTSCDYSNADENIYFTLYASNWPDVALNDHFASALKLMVDRFPLKAEAPVLVANAEIEGATSIEGETLAAGFVTEPIGGETFKTVVWLNKTGPWHVKARATFPVTIVNNEPELSLVEMVAATIHAITLVEVDGHANAAQSVSFSGR